MLDWGNGGDIYEKDGKFSCEWSIRRSENIASFLNIKIEIVYYYSKDKNYSSFNQSVIVIKKSFDQISRTLESLIKGFTSSL